MKQVGAHVLTNGITGPGEHWPSGTRRQDTMRGNFRVWLRDKKGGGPREWPADLVVREFPGVEPEARR